MTLEKKSYPRKIEFDFDENCKNLACFIETNHLILEDGNIVSDRTHRDVVSYSQAMDILQATKVLGEKFNG